MGKLSNSDRKDTYLMISQELWPKVDGVDASSFYASVAPFDDTWHIVMPSGGGIHTINFQLLSHFSVRRGFQCKRRNS